MVCRVRWFRLAVILGAALPALRPALCLGQCSDPQQVWSQAVGGTGEDHSDAVAVDADGNVLVAGRFTGTVDFDPGVGADTRTSEGSEDIFVTKLLPDGTHGWTRTFGGPGKDLAHGLAVDAAGHVLLAGLFHASVDFDPTGGSDVHTAGGAYEDIFITRLNADGTYGWTRTMGGNGSDRARAVAVNGDGDVFITGYFRNTVDFDPGPAVDERESSGGYDVFVTRFAGDGSYAWTRTVGGPTGDWGTGIALGGQGNLLLTGGYTNTVDFDPGPGVDLHSAGGVFVVSMDTGGEYRWGRTFGAHIFGGVDDSFAWSISAAPDGGAVLAGYFYGRIDFDPGAESDVRVSAGQTDAFVTRLNADGTYAWTRTLGSWSYDTAFAVAVAPTGDIMATGSFSMTPDFDPGDGQDKRSSNGWRDIFITRLRADGSYVWTRTAGGVGPNEGGYDVAAGADGDVVVTGQFESPEVDFDPGQGVDVHGSRGASDVFVMKLRCAD